MAGSVLEESSAASAGIKAGDKIISINGEKVERWEDIGRIVSDKAGRVLSVVIDSEGVKKRSLLFQRTMERGAIMGITPSVEKEDVSLNRAVSLGAERCVYILKIMVAGLADILAGAEAGVAYPIGVAAWQEPWRIQE